jgi:integrase/recombinase XerD
VEGTRGQDCLDLRGVSGADVQPGGRDVPHRAHHPGRLVNGDRGEVPADPHHPRRRGRALAEAFTGAFGALAPATRARHLSTVRSALAWWRGCGWLAGDPAADWVRPKVPVDATRALTRDQVAALWRLDVPLRDKTLWRVLYETAAWAEGILGLDVEDLELPGKRARVISKGGMTEWVHWQTGAALLLPRLLGGRRSGPVFLASRKPVRAVATADLCPITGQARLSYRRAAELFEQSTRRLAHPEAISAELASLRGWNLHQLRHSMLTHEAENGTNTPTLLARSRRLRPLPRALRPARPRSHRPPRGRHRPCRTASAASPVTSKAGPG